MTLRRFFLPVILLFLAPGFRASADFQEIAAGVAIFLFGMLMLEDGFRLFCGGMPEVALAKITGSVAKSIGTDGNDAAGGGSRCWCSGRSW